MASPADFMDVYDPRLVRTSEKVTDAQEARERAYEESLREDLATEWCLPQSFANPDQTLRIDGLEQASIDKSIPSSNKGYEMMMRMGWKGGGLGPNGKGIEEPVRGGADRWDKGGGIGKQEELEWYTDENNIERRKMASEVVETETEKEKREVLLEKETKIQESVIEIISVFKCELCNKQYKTVLEHAQHLDSYDHHHKKRLMEMKASFKEKREDILERERKRNEKEMAKFNLAFQQAQQNQAGSQPTAGSLPPQSASEKAAAALPSEENRQAIKIGFGGLGQKAAGKKAKVGLGVKKKPQLAAFQLDDEEEG
ncbi:hypothetical protein CYMTET_13877 [Cymbomonas tetramitiformis]|uniref:G-patch domain-containing protein n=1 Tax=Cymbomonas tetramitiformis TaxID=36881 RepID=A0AAE0GHI6_9CHLO|nr:hypothetical protein CYMTET_13877 [Cymbomonas tetramitiformis]|eukprot:gene8966-10621_t